MDKKVTSIGGQALMEGVMMRGPTSMAMAVRNKDGFIEVDSVRLKPIRWYNKVPVLRGVVSFVESLYNGVNTITKSAQVVGDEDEKINNGGMIFAVCAGVLLAIGLFMLVPELIASLIDGLIGHSVLLKSLIAGALRMIIFVAYLLIGVQDEGYKANVYVSRSRTSNHKLLRVRHGADRRKRTKVQHSS